MIELEEEVEPLRRLALQDFSYSRLTTYKTCAVKYYFSYILKEQQTFGHAATLGNIVHQALEYTLEKDEPIKAFDLIQNFKASIPDFDPGYEIPTDMIDNGQAMLLEFVDRHQGERLPILFKEMPFSVVIGNARFNGYIDRIDVEDDLIRVIDYKSGARQIPDHEVPTDLQLGLYALIAKNLFPTHRVYAELYYLKTGKRKGHLFSTDDLIDVEKRLSLLVSEVLTTENFRPTENSSACYWCDYAKNGVCGTGKNRTNKRKRY